MSLLRKVCQRISDPVFYRKQLRRLSRIATSPGGKTEPRVDWKGWLSLNRVVVVVAHPDDETFCSGLLLDLVAAGVSVEILCLTRGEGGPTGAYSREELGAVREEEMKRACEALGISRVEFLGHVDPVARGYRVFAPKVRKEALAEQLQPLIRDADLVVSHGSCGEYWHPAHLLVFDAVGLAAEEEGLGWMTILARNPEHPIPRLVNRDDRADLRFDVATRRSKREEALECHQSQLGLFGRFAGGSWKDFVEQTAVETYCLRKPPRDRESG